MQEKLDNAKRIIQKFDLSSGLIYRYKYDQNIRIVNICLKNKKSKEKYILIEKVCGDKYVPIKKKEFSEKYIITTIYNEDGNEKKLIRYNRKTRKKYVKINMIFKDNHPVLWIERYSGKMDFGFKIESVKHNL